MAHRGEKRTCPCKKVPLSLSSFTAAEYGDLGTLSKLGSNVTTKRDSAGYTPLHFSAQHNHVAATCLLLQLGCPIDGGGTCGATPLHRAAFSGATSTMAVLIEFAKKKGADEVKAMFLARDTSFGDQATPLHKAVAGGRYLAVQLILDTLVEIQAMQHESSLLSSVLNMEDANRRKPIDIAKRLVATQSEERQSVARWDGIADGKADWEIIVQMLERDSYNQSLVFNKSTPFRDARERQISQTSSLPQLPSHLLQNTMSCLDCGYDNGGYCLTAQWEEKFAHALNQSAFVSLNRRVIFPNSMFCAPCDPPGNTSTNSIADVRKIPTATNVEGSVEARMSIPVDVETSGTKCGACGRATVALYPRNDGALVCKKCKRATGHAVAGSRKPVLTR